MRVVRRGLIASCLLTAIACNGDSGSPPTTPTPTPNPTLTAPSADTPSDTQQLSTLRPTLTVRNGTSDQTGTRTYEFQISDRTDFAATASVGTFAVVSSRSGIAEGGDGRTSFTPDQDLQPSTRLYWRARMTQGTTTSAWSATRSFNTKLVGFNRAGELYDPLIHDETIGEIIGATTWMGTRGIRLDNQNSYVRYLLPQTIASGEFSVEISGLHANAPGAKLRLFSMMDGTYNLFDSKFLFNAQYRGVNGNPDNAFSFKVVYGDEDFKHEPPLHIRLSSVRSLDPSRIYHWKMIWGRDVRQIVEEDRVGGNRIWDYTEHYLGGNYNPGPHYAYLGANNAPFGQEEGTWPGAVYRNLWIGNRERPASLGSALR